MHAGDVQHVHRVHRRPTLFSLSSSFVLLFLFRAVLCSYILAVLLLLLPPVSLVFPSFFRPLDPVAVPCLTPPTSPIQRSISAATCQLSFQDTVLSSAGQSSATSIFQAGLSTGSFCLVRRDRWDGRLLQVRLLHGSPYGGYLF